MRIQEVTAAPPPNKVATPVADELLSSARHSSCFVALTRSSPTKHVRSGLHSLFWSLLVDSRFKCRFAAALGAVAYRPLSTLFCAGVGTESDTPLGFTVQIFTAGFLWRAGNTTATEKLLKSDRPENDSETAPRLQCLRCYLPTMLFDAFIRIC
jgi:hypothetical protein